MQQNVTTTEIIDILKTDIEMSSKSLNSLAKRYNVTGNLDFEEARNWLAHAMDVIGYWEKKQ
jgi:hypothetical protein